MKVERIAEDRIFIYNSRAKISTVYIEVFGRYETMVVFEDGDEIETDTRNFNDRKSAENYHDLLCFKYMNRLVDRKKVEKYKIA